MKITKEFADEAARFATASTKDYYFGFSDPREFLAIRMALLSDMADGLNRLDLSKGFPVLIDLLSRSTKEEREKVMPIVEAATILLKNNDLLGVTAAWIDDFGEELNRIDRNETDTSNNSRQDSRRGVQRC